MKDKTSSQKSTLILILCLAVLICAFVIDAVVLRKTPSAGAANEVSRKVETGSPVTVLTASDWMNRYPDEYNSYMRNSENAAAEDYVAMYPFIATVYEGNAFGSFYASARGHSFTVEDVSETGRPHPQAKCITCKTPDYTAMVNAVGDEAYRYDFNEVISQMSQPISCYSCHGNTGNELVVTHTYLSDAMGEDLTGIEPANLSCGQCHVEYYFYPGTEATTLPYTSLAVMNPDDILAYYNGIDFADYTNPRTGTRQLKAQHPEYETFMGEGSAHAGLLTCADCHMGEFRSSQGYGTGTYSDHYLVSPLEKPEILQNTCARCHSGDVAQMVRDLQADVEARTWEVGLKLETLTNRLADAVASGGYSDEQLDEIRSLNRNAQFYWDFVFVENSEGAHNSALSYDCLDKADALLDQALALF